MSRASQDDGLAQPLEKRLATSHAAIDSTNPQRVLTPGAEGGASAAGWEDPADPDIAEPPAHWAETPAVVGLVVLGSIWGVLIRLGLTAVWTFDGTPVTPLLWSQIVGCALMGFFVASKKGIENHYAPLYAGLTTGLCGSITTFSSFVLQDFFGFSDASAFQRDRFRDFLDGLGQAILTLGMAMAALRFGVHVHTLFKREAPIVRLPSRLYARIPHYTDVHLAGVVLGVAFWVGAIILCALRPQWRGEVTFALVFGPLGAIGRFYLAKLNPRVPAFPLGTFAANMIATVLLAAFTLIQRTGSRGVVACGVLQGLGDGFCGCLSTISTFAVEIRSLSRRNAYRYVLVSWAVGQILVLLVYGVPAFSLSLQPRCAIT